ncbi:MAG: type II secretion system minor pseudopilin GspK, partial [Magnetococcus sp. YQC-5]
SWGGGEPPPQTPPPFFFNDWVGEMIQDIQNRSQQGAALLTALLIVATAATVATGMASQHYLDIRRTANIMDRDRSMQVALGGEAWAMGILSRDGVEGKRDHLNEMWAAQIPPIPVTGGMAKGRIMDMQGRFNLNNLLMDGKPSPVDKLRFERLLQNVDLPPGLAQSVLDWIDPDMIVGGMGGAEDETYLGKKPPYHAANQLFMSVTELTLVEGFDAKAVANLAPFVTALPGRTDLNVNTAPPEVLMTLMDRMTLEDAKDLDEKRRHNDGFADVAKFLEEPIFKGKDVVSTGLSVSSRYFLVDSQVQMGRAKMQLLSLVARQEGHVTVLRRGQGVL